jgi:hypothetical protein
VADRMAVRENNDQAGDACSGSRLRKSHEQHFPGARIRARVWAADLWISAEENWRRVNEAGLSDRVFPLRIEAHALPFPREFFDAVVSLDSYDYYGTDDLYLSYLSCFARPGAEIGVVVPGLMQPIEESVPEHLTRKQDNGQSFWHDDCIRFHTADWWGAHWRRSNCLEAVAADTLPDGWKLWRDFEMVIEKAGTNPFPSAAQALSWDGGRYVGFVRVAGRKKEGINPINLYDTGIISSLGLDMEG